MAKRFKCVRQLDAMQCGVACISMICSHFGRNYSNETLNRYLTPSSEGVSLKGMADLCDVLGIDSVCGRLTVDALAASPLPCVLHWRQNHFVVLYKVTGKKTDKKDSRLFHIADPGKGKTVHSTRELEEAWGSIHGKGEEATKGIAMFFEPTSDFMTRKIDDVPPRRSFRFLLGYMRHYKRQFAAIALGLLIGSLLQLIMPFLTQWIVDIGIKNEDIGFVWLILLGELLIVTGKATADFIRRRILLKISTRINISLVSDFFIKLLHLPMSYFDTKLMGDLLQRMGDHGRVQSFLTSEVLGMVFVVLTFIVLGIVLSIYNLLVFAVFMIGTLLYALWISVFLRRRKVLDYEVFEKEAVNSNLTFRFITSMQEIKLQNCGERRREEWEDSQASLLATQLKRLKLQQMQESGSLFINELRNILVTVFTASAVINHNMTLGGMLAVQYIIGQLSSPVAQIMGFVYSLQDVKISLERINEVHDSENEQSGQPLRSSFPSSERGIELKAVDFKYDLHTSKNTLEDINLNIESGKVTAIVGASGCGKTTLIKLMLGYYLPVGGEITVAGRPLGDYDMKWWRERCGVVMQEGVIFSESIARNIAVADGEIDHERLAAAARISNAEEFILALPLKYDTKIGPDGMGLSLGQRQRILIARAVYKNPDFIFLDEATNSLDAGNERKIVENLQDFYRGKTVVIVAHRLSTVRNANKIIVVEGGKIVETGTHEELIALRTRYYNLVRDQLELGS